MVEREGFEPSVPCGTHAFQACSFGHSDISPRSIYKTRVACIFFGGKLYQLIQPVDLFITTVIPIHPNAGTWLVTVHL